MKVAEEAKSCSEDIRIGNQSSVMSKQDLCKWFVADGGLVPRRSFSSARVSCSSQVVFERRLPCPAERGRVELIIVPY